MGQMLDLREKGIRSARKIFLPARTIFDAQEKKLVQQRHRPTDVIQEFSKTIKELSRLLTF